MRSCGRWDQMVSLSVYLGHVLVLWWCGAVVEAGKGGTVKMLSYPLNTKDPAADRSSYDVAVQSLKRDFDIDLIIEFVPTNQVTDYSGLLTSLLRYNSSEYDIYQIDVIWPGDFGEKFLDLAPYIPESLKAIHNSGIYNANNIQGKQVAVPLYADYGILYYRTDLLQKYNFSGPPETWDEMEKMMEKIVPAEKKTNPSFFGYVGQLNAYEGLTCNFVEWIASNDGGYVVDQYNLSVTVNNPNAIDIVRRMQSWLSPVKGYSPLSSLVYDESLSERMWLAGNALFHRYWASGDYGSKYSPTFPKDAQGQSTFNVARLPGKHRNISAAILGGFQLAANKFTRDVNATVKSIQAMMTPEFQIQRMNTSRVMPTISSLYKDPLFCEIKPECKILETLQVAARPSAAMSPNYLAASQDVYINVNKILRGDITAEEGLRDLSIAVAKTLGRFQDPATLLGPPEFVDLSKPAGIAFMVLAGISAFLTAILFIVVIYFRTHRVLSAASPVFLLMMVAGTLMGHAAIFVYTGRPTNLKCILQPWLIVGGYSVTLAALVSRTWRIYQVFRNTYSMVQINNGELIKACCYLNALNVFLLVLWTFFTPPVPAIVLLKDSHFWTCQSRNGQTGWTIIGLLFAYNALLLGAAVFLTSRTRKVQGPFNEARFVGYAVYTMVLVDIILVPLSFIDTFGATFQYIFRCLAIELSCLAVAYHLFVPKIVALIWNSEIDELAVSTAYVRHGSYPTSEIDSMVGVRQSSGAPAAPSKLPPGIKGHVQENNHTVIDGEICVRWSTAKWCLGFISWRSARIAIIPAMRIMFLFTPQVGNSNLTQPDKEELGVAVEVRTIVFDEIEPESKEEFVFEASVNGVFYQFQVGSAVLRKFWTDAIVGMATIATSSRGSRGSKGGK